MLKDILLIVQKHIDPYLSMPQLIRNHPDEKEVQNQWNIDVSSKYGNKNHKGIE